MRGEFAFASDRIPQFGCEQANMVDGIRYMNPLPA
jgi:hypothetical protein